MHIFLHHGKYNGYQHPDKGEIDPAQSGAVWKLCVRKSVFLNICQQRIGDIGKGIHHRVNDVQQQHGGDHRHRDLPENFPLCSAVDLGSLVQGGGDALQSRKEQQDLHAAAPKHRHQQSEYRLHRIHDSLTEIVQHIIGNQLSVHDVKHRTVHTLIQQLLHDLSAAQQEGYEKYHSEQSPAFDIPVQQNRYDQGQHYGQGKLGQRLFHHLYKSGNKLRVHNKSPDKMFQCESLHLHAHNGHLLADAQPNGHINGIDEEQHDPYDKRSHENQAFQWIPFMEIKLKSLLLFHQLLLHPFSPPPTTT